VAGGSRKIYNGDPQCTFFLSNIFSVMRSKRMGRSGLVEYTRGDRFMHNSYRKSWRKGTTCEN